MFKNIFQWSKDVVNHHNTEPNSQCLSQRKSPDGKMVLHHLSHHHPAVVTNYKLTHEDGRGSILITLYHLHKLYTNLENLILSEVQNGHLNHAESLWRQINNLEYQTYTHRLQVFRMTQIRRLIWSTNIDFHKTDSYGSGTAVEVIKSLLFYLLNKKYVTTCYQDYLEIIIQEDWENLLIENANLLYQGFEQSRIHIISSPKQSNNDKNNHHFLDDDLGKFMSSSKKK